MWEEDISNFGPDSCRDRISDLIKKAPSTTAERGAMHMRKLKEVCLRI